MKSSVGILLETAAKLFRKEFNFTVAPRTMPTEENVCRMETAIRQSHVVTAEALRQDTSLYLDSQDYLYRISSKDNHQPYHIFRKMSSWVVLPVDNGNAALSMDIGDRRKKTPDLLADGTYREILNPTSQINKTIMYLIKSFTSIRKEKRNNSTSRIRERHFTIYLRSTSQCYRIS